MPGHAAPRAWAALEPHFPPAATHFPCIPAAVGRHPRDSHSHASRGSAHLHALYGRISAHFHALRSRSSAQFRAIRSRAPTYFHESHPQAMHSHAFLRDNTRGSVSGPRVFPRNYKSMLSMLSWRVTSYSTWGIAKFNDTLSAYLSDV